GLGLLFVAIIADVDRIDIGDHAPTTLQPIKLLAQFSQALFLGGRGRLFLKRGDLRLQSLDLRQFRAVERNAPAEAVAHGLADIDVVRRAGRREAGAAWLESDRFLQAELDHVGQFKILEEEVQHFLAGKRELEVIFRLAPSRLGAATSAAARGLGNTVARGEFLVAGQDIFTLAIARGMAEGRFARIARRHGHGVCALHVGDLASLDVLLYCPLQLLLRPLEEAPAVADALVLRIKPTIDEIRHEPLSGAPGSARLVDPHVPIYQPAHLSFSIAASGHALDKFGMLLFR